KGTAPPPAPKQGLRNLRGRKRYFGTSGDEKVLQNLRGRKGTSEPPGTKRYFGTSGDEKGISEPPGTKKVLRNLRGRKRYFQTSFKNAKKKWHFIVENCNESAFFCGIKENLKKLSIFLIKLFFKPLFFLYYAINLIGNLQ
ncbi:MAG: hypothetical protein U9O87_06520, partial [Verrucomicrobiota bacterium]|nr:hypothetical protein [Verrucomicrobiota bacterium]